MIVDNENNQKALYNVQLSKIHKKVQKNEKTLDNIDIRYII